MNNYIGIDFGGMSAKGALLDESGVLHKVYSVPTHNENTPEQTADDLARLVLKIAAQNNIVGIGIGSPGIVDSKSGKVAYWTTFGWKDVPLSKLLQEKTGLPTKLLNDANAAVLGEYEYGAAKKYSSAVMLTLGTGVGSGIVIGGKIFAGNKGAGSPRNGLYDDYTDEQMKAVRIEEQKKAATIGEYGAQILLGYSSANVKEKDNTDVIADYVEILKATRPEYVYIHNLADKHITHVATAVKAIEAMRKLPKNKRPKKVYGCKVWRSLDWLCDNEKVLLDCGNHPNLARALSSVFDSQILGGKRYDIAVEGRRLANATFGESHACDEYTALNYAMDVTPLVYDEKLDIVEFVRDFINRFEISITGLLKMLKTQ